MNPQQHLDALSQARYAALDKIVKGSRMKEMGERELASIDSMINLAHDIAQDSQPKDNVPEKSPE